MMDGSDAALDVLRNDTDTSQAAALGRAQKIVKDFPKALSRLGLLEEWTALAGGRDYDLETVEHLLCGWYGVVPSRIRAAVSALHLQGLYATQPSPALSVWSSVVFLNLTLAFSQVVQLC